MRIDPIMLAMGLTRNSRLSAFSFRIRAFLFFTLSLSLGAEKLAEFQEPFEFPALAIDEDRIFIWDHDCVIHIYSRKDYAHLRQFGRFGQGPSEFQFISYIQVLPDRLCIGQGQKVSYFSKNGEFLNTRSNPNPTTGGYMPLGSNYVGTRYLPDDPKAKMVMLAVGLVNSRFKKIKEIYQAEIQKSTVYNFETNKMDVLFVRDCFKYEVYGDRLYIGNSGAGFSFRVFNSWGEKLYDINRSYEKRKISSGDIKIMMTELREVLGEQEFNRRKGLVNQYIYPEFYPAYSDFSAADGKLYVFSYPIPDRPILATILDLHGDFLREIELPRGPHHRSSGSPSYRVYKGRYYYMLYNEESDKWELHVENLDSESLHRGHS